MLPSPEEDLDPSSPRRQLPSDPLMVPHAYAEGDLIAGKYLLCNPIGEGAMGSVWHARDIFVGMAVALKLLRREHRFFGPQREYLAERLTREATALASIRHPAIVRVFDFGSSSWNDPYLAMELLEGESLGCLLARSGPLVPEYAVQLMLPIAQGLAAAHDQGVVHRDLKPDNLFLSIDGRVEPKLIDFGLVKLTRGHNDRKLTGVGLLGTPDYMAPEQALELPNVDHRSDVWAFCVVLYEALSGTLPFSGPTFAETLCAILRRDAAPLTAIGVDAALWQLIERGLRKAPAERWQTVHELGAALAHWLVSKGIGVDVTGTALHTLWPVADADVRTQGPNDAPIPEAPVLPEEVPQKEPTPEEGAEPEPYRAEERSGLRVRHRAQNTVLNRTARPRHRVRAKLQTSAWQVGFRLALAGACAAGVMLSPEPPQLLDQARAVVSSFNGAELNPTPREVDVVHDTDVAPPPALQAQSTTP